jgi:hypothetical protein
MWDWSRRLIPLQPGRRAASPRARFALLSARLRGLLSGLVGRDTEKKRGGADRGGQRRLARPMPRGLRAG